MGQIGCNYVKTIKEILLDCWHITSQRKRKLWCFHRVKLTFAIKKYLLLLFKIIIIKKI